MKRNIFLTVCVILPLLLCPADLIATEEPSLTLVVTGDLMVHTPQLEAARQGSGYDFFESLSLIAPDLMEGDVTAGNLETVFAGAGAGYSDYPAFNTPDSFSLALRQSGFHLVTTANNHCLDGGEAGLLRTLEVLDQAGLSHTGTSSSAGERGQVLLLEQQGFRIAFLAYTAGTNGLSSPQGKEYLVHRTDFPQMTADFARVRALEPHLIVVFPHMGMEYASGPSSPEEELVDFLIAQGADLVLASHPHVLQPMEIRTVSHGKDAERQAFIIYSLGNFLSSQRQESTDSGIVLKLDLEAGPDRLEIGRVRFVPTWVQFRDQSGNPLVRVLPIGDAVAAYGDGNPYRLHPQDLDRIYRAHRDITGLYLEEPVAAGDMQREYIFYER